MKTTTLLTVGMFAALLGSCTNLAIPMEDPFETEPGSEPLSAEELAGLFDPEPGANASDYRSITRTYRLLGSSGEGSTRFATLSDTRNWDTRNVKVGDLLGRNWRVEAITADTTEVASSNKRLTLTVGRNTYVKEVFHKYDRAVTYQGRLRWQVISTTLAQIRKAYGVGARAELRPGVFPRDPVELLDVDPEGVFGRAAFQEHDLLFSAEGRPVQSGDLPRIADMLLDRRLGMVSIEMMRGGGMQQREYEIR